MFSIAFLYSTICVYLSSSICDQLYINRCWLLYCFLCMFLSYCIYDLCLLQCVHIIRIYIFRGHINWSINLLFLVVFLMWIDLDKYKLDRCEILFTITKMRRSGNKAGPLRPSDLNNNYWCEAIFIYLLKYINKINFSYQKR